MGNGYRGLVTATRRAAKECDTDTRYLRTEDNVVRFAIVQSEMEDLCPIATGACATGVRVGNVYTHNIVVDDTYSITDDDRGCSTTYRAMQHEIGHVYGLNDPSVANVVPGPDDSGIYNNLSVMYTPDDLFCSPTAYDIVAMRALHQSGYNYGQ